MKSADVTLTDTPGVSATLRLAKDLADDEVAGAVHLLRALTLPGSRFANVLRSFELLPDLDGIPASEGDVPLAMIHRSAAEIADTTGSTSVGLQHLMVAAVDAATGLLRDRLQSQGVTPERAMQLLAQSPEWLLEQSQPGSITVLGSALLVIAVLCGGTGALVHSGTGFSEPYSGQLKEIILLAWTVWAAFGNFLVGIGVIKRQLWAWGGGVGLLTLHAVTLLFLLLVSNAAPVVLLGLIVHATLATELISKASWFSVPRDRVWRTLWQVGWWAMVPTLLLQLALLLATQGGPQALRW